MRCAIALVCFSLLPGLVVAQVATESMPALLCAPIEVPGSSVASPPTASIGPTAGRYFGSSYFGMGQFAAGATPRRPVWSDPSTWAGAPQPPRVAVYSHNPYYPSAGYTAKPEILRVENMLQPVPRTPLHDPYFDERVDDPYEDFDPYEYWGW